MKETGAEAELFPGVRALDHTADIGFEANAATLPELFHRAGRALMVLIRGEERRVDRAGEPEWERRRPAYMTGEWKRIALDADNVESLMVAWLRELLWLYESSRFAYQTATFDALDENSLVGQIGGASDGRPAVREIKGVTYHDLEVARDDGGWHARVILDV